MLCSSKKYIECDITHLNCQAFIFIEINVNLEWFCALFSLILIFWIGVAHALVSESYRSVWSNF